MILTVDQWILKEGYTALDIEGFYINDSDEVFSYRELGNKYRRWFRSS
ncbi:hypothetical protein Phi39:1_gp46 [Cellulophaga phage phi39:1]|nr:hypothetical protein Phi39:1_gp46 [Cellulophaga phage phi39:1]AGO49161.1 hypothetical protein Phi39:1_gp46 [Cellulophaga phage phi39:1]